MRRERIVLAGLSPAVFWASASAALVGGFVQGVTGYGLGLLLLPLLALLAPSEVPQTILILGLPAVAWVALKERGILHMSAISWILIGRVAGTGVGVAALVVLSPRALQLTFGVGTIVAAALTSLRRIEFRVTVPARLVAGAISGLMGTAVGVGGPPIALLYLRRSASEVRATLSFVFLVGTSISLFGISLAGRLHLAELELAGALFVPTVLGLALSRRLLHTFSSRAVRLFVLAIAVGSGLAVIVQALT